MSKSTPQFSEIVSLAVMLLMVIALVAAQADDTIPSAAADSAMTSVEISHFRLEDE